MTDIALSLSVNGATESAANVTKVGKAFEFTTDAADLNSRAIAKTAAAMAQATEQARLLAGISGKTFGKIELDGTPNGTNIQKTTDAIRRATEQAKALDSVTKRNGGGHGGGMSLANLAPTGFEGIAGRIGHITGLNEKFGEMPNAGALALGAFVGFMALEKTVELLNASFEHAVKVANDLAAAQLAATKSAIESTKAQQEAGRGQAATDLDTTKQLAAIGGDALIRQANKATVETGDKTARAATAEIYGKFTDAADRERGMKLAAEASRLGLGTMGGAAGALTPYNIRNVDEDQFLREFGAVGGRPLTAEELNRRRANAAGSRLGAQAAGIGSAEANLENIKRAQVGGALAAVGAEQGKVAVPSAEKLGGSFMEYTQKREALLREQDEVERRKNYQGIALPLFQSISSAGQYIAGSLGVSEGTPLQRIAKLDTEFNASSNISINAIRAELARTNQGLAQILGSAAASLTQASSLLQSTNSAQPASP